MLIEQLKNLDKPVVIMPIHLKSVLLYHALIDARVRVLGFLDNNADLDGKSYDGVKITLPENGMSTNDAVDAVVIIFYKKYEDAIREQLLNLGYKDIRSAQNLALDELKNYYDCIIDDEICDISPKYERVLYTKNGSYPLSPVPYDSKEQFFKFIYETTGKYEKWRTIRKVLLVSHEMSITGAPILLQNAAMAITDNGGLPIMCCKTNGELVSELTNNDIPVIIDYKIADYRNMKMLCSLFDAVIVNTYSHLSIMALECLDELSIPAMWWIHEAGVLYSIANYKKIMPSILGRKIYAYAGGGYAKKMLIRAGAKFPIGIQLYGIKDLGVKPGGSSGDKLEIMTIGTIELRKGQDIFCEAIRRLSSNICGRCEFHFIGIVGKAPGAERVYKEVLALQRDFPDNVILHGEVGRDSIGQALAQCDCMVCASRDDPMPLFIAEAMMFGKVCICSENTGYVDLIEDGVNGFLYGDNSSEKLCKKITYVVENFEKLDDMRKNSRETYDEYFSYERFSDKFIKIIDNLY